MSVEGRKKFATVIITAIITSIVTIAVIGGAIALGVTTYKAELFDYFASNYINNLSENNAENDNSSELNVLSPEKAITDLVDESNPAVVSIVVTKDVPVIEQYYEEFNPLDDFFGSPFGGGFNFQFPRYRENGTEEREVGGGSGFFVTNDGLIVTNRHVVADEDADYSVLTNDGESYEAKVLARDPFLDIAIIEIDIKNARHLRFGNSDNLKLGQTVVAIGNALGEFRNSVSVGVVSGLSRSIVAGDGFGTSEVLEEVLQTDAAINPGNSGGPLLNTQGEVIGVNVAVARGSENIGFALPANLVKSTVDSVKEFGEIVRPYIGVRYINVTESLQEKNNLEVDHGALVIRGDTPEDLAVIPGSPADKAGIVENDIILEVDGVKIEEGKSLGLLIRQHNVGDKVKLKVLSKGEEKTVEVQLEKAPQ